MLFFSIFNIHAQTDSTSEEKIYMMTDQMPLFPGCDSPDVAAEDKKKCSDQNVLQFIYNYIQYPDSARMKGIQGSVVVGFVVEKNGKISNAKLLKDIGGGCGEEALRVVNLMNQLDRSWSPGMKDGEPVRVSFNIPIKYKLEDTTPPEFTLYGNDTIWQVYDKAAEFTGGFEGLAKSVEEELNYPASGFSTCKVGAMEIQLLVKGDKSVELLDLKDYGGLGLDFWYETIDWYHRTKSKWAPAIRGDKEVSTLYSMRVPFKPSSSVKLDTLCTNRIQAFDEAAQLAFQGEDDFNSGNKEEAFAKWNEAIEKFPGNAEFLLLRGQAALESGDFETACSDFAEAKAILGVAGWVEQMLFWTCLEMEKEK